MTLGSGLAAIGICAVVGLAVWITKDTGVLWWLCIIYFLRGSD